MRFLLPAALVLLVFGLIVPIQAAIPSQALDQSPGVSALQNITPTVAGAGGLLTPEPIETGAPPTPRPLVEDPAIWGASILMVLLVVLLLAGLLYRHQRKSSRR